MGLLITAGRSPRRIIHSYTHIFHAWLVAAGWHTDGPDQASEGPIQSSTSTLDATMMCVGIFMGKLNVAAAGRANLYIHKCEHRRTYLYTHAHRINKVYNNNKKETT